MIQLGFTISGKRNALAKITGNRNKREEEGWAIMCRNWGGLNS